LNKLDRKLVFFSVHVDGWKCWSSAYQTMHLYTP